MQQAKKTSLVLDLIDSLKTNGSWCGETHIQKAVFFLQELTGVPTGFEFILYKHGPFSFDLRDELSSMQADDLLKIKLQPYPYGPSLEPTDASLELRKRFPVTRRQYKRVIDFVAENLGELGVAELERIATALYVTRQTGEVDSKTRADSLCRLKPHVSYDKALKAVEDLDQLLKDLKTH